MLRLAGWILAAALSVSVCSAELSTEDFRFDWPLGSDGAKIEKTGGNAFKITLGHAPQHPDWANNCQFQILRNAKGNALRLEVVFEHAKPQYLFDEYFHSWSYNGKDWTPIQWAKKSNGKLNQLSFPAFEQDQVTFGLQVPMSYEDAVELLQGWAKHPHAKLSTCGESAGGRKLYRLEITDPESAHPRAKRWTHYIANEHPGEHNAQWRIAGAVNWLLSDAGADCRRRSICYFVLMMSPDSPSKGWYRVNADGMDMNRSYRFDGANEKEQTREAYLCQKALEALMASDAPPTDCWSMHTWGGIVETIVSAGPEVGKSLGGKDELIETFKKNDTQHLLKPLKITEPARFAGDEKSPTWQRGICHQFGSTAVLCEGGGSIFSQAENVASGAVIMKSLAEYYSGLRR